MIVITTHVFCNICSTWIGDLTGPRTRTVEVRKMATEFGWVRRDGEDICDMCQKPEPTPDAHPSS